MLVCTLLPGALDSIIETGLTPYLGHLAVEHITQSSGIYSRIPANTPDNFLLSQFL